MSLHELQACQVAILPVPGWECFFARNDTEFRPLSFYVWIVKNEDKVGLIDTGLPLDEAERPRLQEACQGLDRRCVFTNIVTLDELYRQYHLSPNSIDFVLLTQTITYHSGGLLPQLFPRAQVYLSRAGIMEFLLRSPGHPPRDLYFTEDSWSFLHRLLIEERLHLVDDPVEVAPGLIFETTGGHHPGSAGVRVRTSQGIVGILETAFLRGNVEEAHPIGIAENVALCRQVIERYNRECDLVLAGHDPTIIERFAEGRIR
jgi:glyoxylase-like metal-dependent hydrolase (beta-lactamase superfamily II)